MTKPGCSRMESRPSIDLEGWDQWGLIDESGNFIALWGLQQGNSHREAMYELDAAGICDIRGKDQLGQMSPTEEPTPNLASAGQIIQGSTAETVAVEPQSEVPFWADLPPIAYGLIAVLAVASLWGLAYKQAQKTKATDTTPAPLYPQNPYNGR